MICRTGQICKVPVADNELHFFTISNLNYAVFVSLAHIPLISPNQWIILLTMLIFNEKAHLNVTHRCDYAWHRHKGRGVRGQLPPPPLGGYDIYSGKRQNINFVRDHSGKTGFDPPPPKWMLARTPMTPGTLRLLLARDYSWPAA